MVGVIERLDRAWEGPLARHGLRGPSPEPPRRLAVAALCVALQGSSSSWKQTPPFLTASTGCS